MTARTQEAEFPADPSAASRIERMAHELLERSGRPELRRVQCEYDGEALVLQGRVKSFYIKQLAQTLAGHVLLRVGAGLKLDNRLEVARGATQPARSA